MTANPHAKESEAVTGMIEMNDLGLTPTVKVLESARRKLLDTGTRNRLVHVNRTNQRANCLNIINERSNEIYEILRSQSKRMRFKAMGKDKTGEGDEMQLALPDEEISDSSDRLTDNFIETPLGPEALARRLLRLATAARTAEEEQGVNILYLALGFLRWRESPSSEIDRESPLILLPVRLVRNERSSTYDILCRDDDITTNLPLQERLRQDFGIYLPEIDEGEGWSPSEYFSQATEVIAGKPGWSIDADGMQLGFYSFAKLLMHRDLDTENWPEGAFVEHPLLKGLLTDGFPADEPLFKPEDKLDDLLDPAEIIQVIDADASQTKVIEEVRAGSSLVVQGPPGTGKSQTITNIIAAAAHDGKTVLFVAEKLAALSVVHDRLVKAGLRDICLELHSRSANKKALAQELGRTLAASSKALPGASDPAQLRKTRDELNRICAILHQPLQDGEETPYQAIAEIIGFIGKGAPAPTISDEGLERLDRKTRSDALRAIGDLVAALERIGEPEDHPFRGTSALDLQPTDLERLGTELEQATSALDDIAARLSEAARTLHCEAPRCFSEIPPLLEKLELLATAPEMALTVAPYVFDLPATPRFVQQLEIGKAWQETLASDGPKFTTEAHETELVSMRAAFEHVLASDFATISLPPDQLQTELSVTLSTLDHLDAEVGRIAQEFSQPRPQTLTAVRSLAAGLHMLNDLPPNAERLISCLFERSNQGRLVESIEAGIAWSDAYKAADQKFGSQAWDVNLTDTRAAILAGQSSFLSRLFGGYRRASGALAAILSGPLPASPAERLALVDQLADVQTKRKRFSDDETWLRTILSEEWRNERTDFRELKAVALWLGAARATGAFADAEQLTAALSGKATAKQEAVRLEGRAQALSERLEQFVSFLGLDQENAALGSELQSQSISELREVLCVLINYLEASKAFATILSEPIPDSARERLGLLETLSNLQKKRMDLSKIEPELSRVLGSEWQGARTDFSNILTASEWIWALRDKGAFSVATHLTGALEILVNPVSIAASLMSQADAGKEKVAAPISRLQLDLDEADFATDVDLIPFEDLRGAFCDMAKDKSAYADWAALIRAENKVAEAGASVMLDAIYDGSVAPRDAPREFSYACAEARWNQARKTRPELNDLPGLDRHDLVRLFKDLETDRIELTKNLVLSRHFDQMPRGTMGEMGFIRGEIGRKRGHKPIRKVMRSAGGMVQRIKPVMLMSPISVAQFLPPGNVSFDLLLIDEASQIKPEDALGVIARARQIVVVGDQKQLPPTSFFDRLVDDADEEEDEDEEMPVGATASDMESILSLCEARGLRSRMLEWHYRSRDPSLIQVSNAEFYNDGLVLPPSPLQLDPDYGLKFTRVPGVYARGGSGVGRQGTNRIEAEAVAKAVAAHARAWPKLSLGVIAFSKTQATMLTEMLELHRRRDPILDAFLREGKVEDVFVKNIENVQGDERDVILISVGYGPQEPNGRLSAMNFGPVNGEGGERRLNVLFSRARVRCEVFASFDPADIDPSGAKREGPRVLKRFLEFAKTGIVETRAPTGLGADSPFEEDVAEVIRSLGYLADPQVGTAGFRIDIGVRHPDRPGQYFMAVECDGATYHSALWARERDRLRQGILENLGWKFLRIWSTDWFHQRERQIERLKGALEVARRATEDGVRVGGSNDAPQSVPDLIPENSGISTPAFEISETGLCAVPYARADLTVRSAVEPHEAPVNQLTELVLNIVEIEGPIHTDEIARRISLAFGRSRTGNRIVDATRRAVALAVARNETLLKENGFLLTTSQKADPPVRDRSKESGSLLKAIYLPPLEIAAAAKLIREESGEMAKDELIRAIARLLGFMRVGPELAGVIDQTLEES